MEFFSNITYEIFSQFIDPRKRIFLGYLFVSILIAFFWLFIFRKNNIKSSLTKIFSKKVFFSTSAKSDYKIFFINQILMSFFSPLLITQLTIATFLYYFFHSISWLSPGILENNSALFIMLVFTSTHFILEDFTKFIIHRWMHKWPVLWALHKVHHSATNLTPITVFRTHPLEGILFSLRSSFTQAITISTFIFLFGSKVDLITVLGANIFTFTFNIFGSNLRHSHIGIRYWWWLEYFLISPAQHQLHHSISKKHHNKNFGMAFAIWDWLFDSLSHSEEIEKLELGLTEKKNKSPHSLKSLYLNPITEILLIFKIQIVKIINYFKAISLRRLLSD